MQNAFTEHDVISEQSDPESGNFFEEFKAER